MVIETVVPDAEAVVQEPEVEVSSRPTRRSFTAQEKLDLLREADACTKKGELGALLRRAGIYSSYLTAWRQAQAKGELEALTPKKRGPKAVEADPRDQKIAELQRALAKAEARARHAEALIEVQKKVSELLGIQLPKDPEVP
jgi:transposase